MKMSKVTIRGLKILIIFKTTSIEAIFDSRRAWEALSRMCVKVKVWLTSSLFALWSTENSDFETRKLSILFSLSQSCEWWVCVDLIITTAFFSSVFGSKKKITHKYFYENKRRPLQNIDLLSHVIFYLHLFTIQIRSKQTDVYMFTDKLLHNLLYGKIFRLCGILKQFPSFCNYVDLELQKIFIEYKMANIFIY